MYLEYVVREVRRGRMHISSQKVVIPALHTSMIETCLVGNGNVILDGRLTSTKPI